jgi:uncharacterized protein (TIGR00251 family)
MVKRLLRPLCGLAMTRITVKVKPNSKTELVEKISKNEFVVRVKAPAKEGKANEAVVEVLSEYFARPKSRITILRGQAGKNKVVEIS